MYRHVKLADGHITTLVHCPLPPPPQKKKKGTKRKQCCLSCSRYEGLEVVSPNEFEVVLYLNQMGVFNFVDDGTIPGCAVLKLSDGRKRSMSLWVEFITASGYLSARKIRSRFQTLVAQAVDKCSYRDIVKMIPDTTEVKLRIKERHVVQITPAFRCGGIWCRSAAHWPTPHTSWPSPNLVAEVKTEGFDLLSKESIYMKVGS